MNIEEFINRIKKVGFIPTDTSYMNWTYQTKGGNTESIRIFLNRDFFHFKNNVWLYSFDELDEFLIKFIE